jgi:hypothetical protein
MADEAALDGVAREDAVMRRERREQIVSKAIGGQPDHAAIGPAQSAYHHTHSASEPTKSAPPTQTKTRSEPGHRSHMISAA